MRMVVLVVAVNIHVQLRVLVHSSCVAWMRHDSEMMGEVDSLRHSRDSGQSLNLATRGWVAPLLSQTANEISSTSRGSPCVLRH